VVSLTVLFWMYIILFAFIGTIRGWAKELLVTFGVILAIFIITVLLPFIDGGFDPETLFWVRLIILGLLVFFGYQTPNIRKLAESGVFIRERLQDFVLGIFLGAINGFLFFGTAWFYLHEAGYPFDAIAAPDATTAAGQAALNLINILPPNWLQVPAIYFAIAISFVFVLVVFI